uniref:Transposase domain containing protein n=1 Tax=Haemonchus contortus TaxID=6289 RepID=W6NEW6_HAECO
MHLGQSIHDYIRNSARAFGTISKMISQHQLRTIIFYEWRQGKSAREATDVINSTLGEGTVHRSTVSRWHNRFASGDISLEDKVRSGRARNIDEDELLRAVTANPEATTRELSTILGCSHSTIENFLHVHGYRKVLSRWIPHRLTDAQKQARVNICESLLFQPNRKDFLADLVTGDESWILYDYRKRTTVWLPRGVEPPTQPKPNPHQRKHLLSVWWDMRGVVYYELLAAGRTVTASIYIDQLQHLADAIREKRPRRSKVYLQHDNARLHVASETRQKIAELGWHPVAHPPYSPDLAPSDYHLFQPLKHHLRGREFKTYSDLKFAVNDFFESQSPDFWAKGISDSPKRWEKVINLCGEYIVDI